MTRVEMFREKLHSLNISDYHGLNSPGVTCYLNSVLQVLFMTEDFREAVKGLKDAEGRLRDCQDGSHSELHRRLFRNPCSREDSTTIDEHLRRLFSDLEKSVAKTHNMTKKLGITNVYEQRDAAEYFEKILCRTSPEAARMFKGELNYTTTCLGCLDRSDSRGFFWMLPLAVEDWSRQSYSVEKGLRAFFKGEKVCGDNKIYCNRCAKKQDADFGCEMTQTPEVLTLLLKRFTFDSKRGCYVKLHCKVDVPQILHTEDCDYDLYALVHHFGTLTGGHYTAQIRSFETQVWYDFNDGVVKGVKALFGVGGKSLTSSTAYLLMYRKVRRKPEKMTEGDQEAPCAYSDVEPEGRHEEAERGAALVAARHQLKDESRNGGETVKHLTRRDDAVTKEKRPRRTAACTWPQKETSCTEDGYKDATSNPAKLQKHGQQTSRRLDTSSSERVHLIHTSEQNHTPRKKRLMSNPTDRNRAAVSPNVYHYDVKSLHGSSKGCSYSLQLNLTGHSQSHPQPNEPFESNYSSNPCRKSNRSKKDTEKTQHVLTADSRKKNAAKSKDKVKVEPWRS